MTAVTWSQAVLLMDIGSTHTKLTAVDLARPTLLGQAHAPTTVDDVGRGFAAALDRLAGQLGSLPAWRHRLACSSAAGGLRLVAIGLVPKLTAEAARRAALGAGARVIAAYAYQLTEEDTGEIKELQPDIILLAGGTDGGNRTVLLANAARLAAADVGVPIVVAGNREAAPEAARILRQGGQDVWVTENVMPRLNALNVEPARRIIREIFFRLIVEAKGMADLARQLDGVLMPTPAAVLQGAQLLADGSGPEPGLGPLMVVDIGGATTDVHSIAHGEPSEPGVQVRGLAEPYAKRTVEGDLGLRHSAPGILAAAGEKVAGCLDRPQGELEPVVARLAEQPEYVPAPSDEEGRRLDRALAAAATAIAVERHVGRLKERVTAAGTMRFQEGKDLRRAAYLVGTGGIFRLRENVDLLRHGCAGPGNQGEQQPSPPEEGVPLLPVKPILATDSRYLLAPMGLLATVAPEPALQLLKQHLTIRSWGGNRSSPRRSSSSQL